MVLHHGVVDWSAVCDCDISWSYSLTFCYDWASMKKFCLDSPREGHVHVFLLSADFLSKPTFLKILSVIPDLSVNQFGSRSGQMFCPNCLQRLSADVTRR